MDLASCGELASKIKMIITQAVENRPYPSIRLGMSASVQADVATHDDSYVSRWDQHLLMSGLGPGSPLLNRDLRNRVTWAYNALGFNVRERLFSGATCF